MFFLCVCMCVCLWISHNVNKVSNFEERIIPVHFAFRVEKGVCYVSLKS